MTGKITLCEYARAASNGALYDALSAGITLLLAPQFPAPITVSILVESRFTFSEAGKTYPFEIRFMDQDGKPIIPSLVGAIQAGKNSQGMLYSALTLNFLAKGPQKLTIALLVNGEEKDSLNCEIKQGVPPQPINR